MYVPRRNTSGTQSYSLPPSNRLNTSISGYTIKRPEKDAPEAGTARAFRSSFFIYANPLPAAAPSAFYDPDCQNGSAFPVTLWNKNTFYGFKSKCTVRLRVSTRLSAVDDRADRGFSASRMGSTSTLTSLPSTSTRFKLAPKSAVFLLIKSPRDGSRRSPGWSLTPPHIKHRLVPEPKLSCRYLSRKYRLMGGFPRNFATNRLAGSSYTSWGGPSA